MHLESFGVPGGNLSLVVDAAGKAHGAHTVTLTASSGAHLAYSSNTSGSWQTVTADGSSSNLGHWTSMSSHTLGKLHIAYWDLDGGRDLALDGSNKDRGSTALGSLLNTLSCSPCAPLSARS